MKITNVPKKRSHKGLIILLVIAVVIAALLLDSNYRIVASTYELRYDNLPESFNGYRVVQLSDLHMADYGEKLVDKVRTQQPDIIVLTGDFLNMNAPKTEDGQTQRLRPTLEALAAIAPCYFVSGNHEWASGEMTDLSALMSELGISYLKNEFILLEKEGESIVLAGVEDPNGPADMLRPNVLAERIRSVYLDKYVLLLAHRNDLLVKYPNLAVNTVLCGHAHGGIVRLPYLGGVFGTDATLFPKYDAGAFNEGGYDMVLSRGLGGYTRMPRFLNNPEIVTVILNQS